MNIVLRDIDYKVYKALKEYAHDNDMKIGTAFNKVIPRGLKAEKEKK